MCQINFFDAATGGRSRRGGRGGAARCGGRQARRYCTNLDVAKLDVDDQIARGRVVRFTTGGDIVIHKFSKSMRSRMWSSGKAGSVASWRRGAGHEGDAPVSQGRPATTKQRRNAVRNTHEKFKERESKRSSEAKAEAAKQHEAGSAAKAAIAARRIDIEQSVAAERAKQRDEQASMGVIDISVPDRHAATVEGGKRQAVVARRKRGGSDGGQGGGAHAAAHTAAEDEAYHAVRGEGRRERQGQGQRGEIQGDHARGKNGRRRGGKWQVEIETGDVVCLRDETRRYEMRREMGQGEGESAERGRRDP